MGAVLSEETVFENTTEDLAHQLHKDGVSFVDVASKVLGYERLGGTGGEPYLLSATGDYIAIIKGQDGLERAVSLDLAPLTPDIVAFTMAHHNTLRTPEEADAHIRTTMALGARHTLNDELRTQNDGALHAALAFSHVLQKQGASLTVIATSLFGYQDISDRDADERYLYHPVTGDVACVSMEPVLGVEIASFTFGAGGLHALNFARAHDTSLPSKPMKAADALRDRLRSAGVALKA